MVTSYIAITMISVEWSKDFFGPHLKNFLDTLGACSGLLLHQPTICDKHLLEYASSTLLASQLPPMPTMSMVPGTQDIYHKFYQLCYNLRNEASDNLRIKRIIMGINCALEELRLQDGNRKAQLQRLSDRRRALLKWVSCSKATKTLMEDNISKVTVSLPEIEVSSSSHLSNDDISEILEDFLQCDGTNDLSDSDIDDLLEGSDDEPERKRNRSSSPVPFSENPIIRDMGISSDSDSDIDDPQPSSHQQHEDGAAPSEEDTVGPHDHEEETVHNGLADGADGQPPSPTATIQVTSDDDEQDPPSNPVNAAPGDNTGKEINSTPDKVDNKSILSGKTVKTEPGNSGAQVKGDGSKPGTSGAQVKGDGSKPGTSGAQVKVDGSKPPFIFSEYKEMYNSPVYFPSFVNVSNGSNFVVLDRRDDKPKNFDNKFILTNPLNPYSCYNVLADAAYTFIPNCSLQKFFIKQWKGWPYNSFTVNWIYHFLDRYIHIYKLNLKENNKIVEANQDLKQALNGIKFFHINDLQEIIMAQCILLENGVKVTSTITSTKNYHPLIYRMKEQLQEQYEEALVQSGIIQTTKRQYGLLESIELVKTFVKFHWGKFAPGSNTVYDLEGSIFMQGLNCRYLAISDIDVNVLFLFKKTATTMGIPPIADMYKNFVPIQQLQQIQSHLHKSLNEKKAHEEFLQCKQFIPLKDPLMKYGVVVPNLVYNSSPPSDNHIWSMTCSRSALACDGNVTVIKKDTMYGKAKNKYSTGPAVARVQPTPRNT